MEFQQALVVMSDFMNVNPESGYLFANKRQEVDKTIRAMIKDLDDLAINAPIQKQLQAQTLNSVRNSITLIKGAVTGAVVTTKFSEFIDGYFSLVDNWNQSFFKDEAIFNDLVLIDRYKNLHFTAAEIIAQSKDLLKRYKNLQNFALPSIEMSKHYLKSFDNKVEEIGEENKEQLHAKEISKSTQRPITLEKQEAKKEETLGSPVLVEKVVDMPSHTSAGSFPKPGVILENKKEETPSLKTNKLKFNNNI